MPHHLTVEERDRIAQLRHQGADQKEIARALNRSPSTISRELRRNGTGGEYFALRPSDGPNSGGGSGLWCERWTIPRLMRPSVAASPRGGRRNRSPDGCDSSSPTAAFPRKRLTRGSSTTRTANTGKRCGGGAANARIVGKTRPWRATAPASTNVQRSSSSGCGWAISKATPDWAAGHGRPGHARRSQVAADDRRQDSIEERRPRSREAQAAIEGTGGTAAALDHLRQRHGVRALPPAGKAPGDEAKLC